MHPCVAVLIRVIGPDKGGIGVIAAAYPLALQVAVVDHAIVAGVSQPVGADGGRRRLHEEEIAGACVNDADILDGRVFDILPVQAVTALAAVPLPHMPRAHALPSTIK